MNCQLLSNLVEVEFIQIQLLLSLFFEIGHILLNSFWFVILVYYNRKMFITGLCP